MKAARRARVLLCGAALLAAPLRAAEPAADADLLEYLGSVDSEDAIWHDYLAATDIDKLAQTRASTPAASPAAKPPPPASAPPALAVPGKVKPT